MQLAKHGVVNLIGCLLGRRSTWRLGRSLYMGARADAPDDIADNGELTLQSAILDIYQAVPDLTIFDVGAHLGNWTLHLLNRVRERNLRNVEIHAFEPVPATFATLSQRVHNHPLADQVHLVQAVASDVEGQTPMNVYREFDGRNSLELDPLSSVRDGVQVRATTLEAYCRKRGVDQIHLLKCDTGGHDVYVLQGARALFADGRVMVCQFEYNHLWVYSRHFLKDVFDFIVGRPYVVAKLTPQALEVHKSWHPELERFFEGNWLLLHKSVLEYLPLLHGSFDRSNTFNSTLTPPARRAGDCTADWVISA